MQSLKELILSWEPKGRSRQAAKRPGIVDELNTLYPGVPLKLQISAIVHDRSPYCVVCNTPVKHPGKICCSLKCRSVYTGQFTEDRLAKQRSTLQRKYGVDNIRQIPGATEKRHATMMEKYGALVSPLALEKAVSRLEQLQVKGRKTMMEKYGVTSPSQLPDYCEKKKATLIRNYGVDHYAKSEEAKQRSKDYQLSRWSSLLPNTTELISIDEPAEGKKSLFADPNRLITFKCLTCNTVESLPSETAKWRVKNYQTCCTVCSGIVFGSAAQNNVNEYITSLGIKTIQNERVQLTGKEIDIFIPDLCVGFEYDGLFWHNDSRVNPLHHLHKTTLALNAGIHLIHLFENEWLNSPAIVKSRIAHILGKTANKIHARQCTSQVVSVESTTEFLKLNHLQPDIDFSVAIGLHYCDQLVAVSTFKQKDASWELTNFCVVLNTAIPGAASKLFSYFRKLYDPAVVTAKSDRRWNKDSMFAALDFCLTAQLDPVAWGIDLAANNLSPATSTSELKIWDCGYNVYSWKK